MPQGNDFPIDLELPAGEVEAGNAQVAANEAAAAAAAGGANAPLGKDYAITYLNHETACYLSIDNWNFELAQVTTNWAINEIPTAICLLGIGRNAKDGKTLANVHKAIGAFTQMDKAKIWFTPLGEYDPDGTPWPVGNQLIFDGYFAGFATRKINGKLTIEIRLKHWLMDLTCSSIISANSHPSNPTVFTAPCVLNQLDSSLPANTSFGMVFDAFRGTMVTDLWEAFKEIFCFFADFRVTDITDGECLGLQPAEGGDDVDGRGNARAANALSKIEGPGGDCSKPYKWGKPLPLLTKFMQNFDEAIANAVSGQMVEGYANTTMWDKLILEFCHMFNMAVVPLVQSALVVADVPCYNGANVWKTISVGDYDALDQIAEMDHPIRAVAVVARYPSQANPATANIDGVPVIGGCFVPTNVDDGIVRIVESPVWLRNIGLNGVRCPSGTDQDKPSPTATTPDSKVPTEVLDPEEISNDAEELFSLFAQSVYAAQTLRGRGGSLSGKLRFDIAPGSHVLISPTGEKFIGAEDQLITPLYAHVNRVTITINCENAIAQTSFGLTHIRTATENTDPRTSIGLHPLFGKNVVVGAPLVDGLNI